MSHLKYGMQLTKRICYVFFFPIYCQKWYTIKYTHKLIITVFKKKNLCCCFLFPWRQTCLWLMFFCFTSIVKTNSSLWRNSIHKCCLCTYSKYTFIMKSSFLGHFNESKKQFFQNISFFLSTTFEFYKIILLR